MEKNKMNNKIKKLKFILAVFMSVVISLNTTAGFINNAVYAKTDFVLSDIPVYTTSPYVVVNNNEPFFTSSDYSSSSYEYYSDLDSLGRCGPCIANIGRDIMPTEPRGNIGSVKPTGWHSVRYNGIDGNYLYNRCHLIGFQLAGENANPKNLITGTRYLNVIGMLPFEDLVADYVKETDNHVLYRVTPIFEGDNLVANGVLMEGKSVEDDGLAIKFNVFCYNVQPGVTIDYATGESTGPEYTGSTNPPVSTTTKILGDMNGDNKINSTDASIMLVLYTSGNYSVEEIKTGDLNEDGKLNSTDATIALQYYNDGTVINIDVPTTPVEEEVPEDTDVNGEITYILNSNTKKFHLPTCSSVKTIAEGNKVESTSTKEVLLLLGYEGCKRCNP